ncbi:MAG TPA: metallophosphoesterase family protein, partial [Planctomycetota bacterium]|nr:metallophosphoesterase family protein [Planctomycetota bacterium]
MKFGVLGDVHANWEALNIVLDFLQKENITKIFCLGDIVGYNADPGECLDLLQKNNVLCISGNHDRFTSGEIDAVIRPETRQVIEYTKKSLSTKQRDFIASLPEERYLEDIFLFVHGSPREKDEYINSLQIARSNLQFLRRERPYVSICFFGHTHLPYVISNNTIEMEIHQNRDLKLDPKYTYLINPGSVGQPRDQCPCASFVIFDYDEYTVSFYRIPYDIPETQRKIRAA